MNEPCGYEVEGTIKVKYLLVAMSREDAINRAIEYFKGDVDELKEELADRGLVKVLRTAEGRDEVSKLVGNFSDEMEIFDGLSS